MYNVIALKSKGKNLFEIVKFLIQMMDIIFRIRQINSTSIIYDYIFSKDKINPLIGSAGVSAVPMAARVSNKVGLEANPQNYLLMHAMGPNVAGVIGSAVAAGILLALCH